MGIRFVRKPSLMLFIMVACRVQRRTLQSTGNQKNFTRSRETSSTEVKTSENNSCQTGIYLFLESRNIEISFILCYKIEHGFLF